MEEKDKLLDFYNWFFSNVSGIGAVPLFQSVHKVEDITSVIWYRDEEFQVQLFIVPGNVIIPEHTHPNVDSFEVYVGGQVRFSHKGKWLISEEDLKTPTNIGTSIRRGVSWRVKPEDIHGAMTGPEGGVFMSVQHWLNGVKPHCVAADYSGVVMGDHHLSTVKFGDATKKESLTIKDAASLNDTNS